MLTDIESIIAGIGTKQHGVVTRWQLLDAGVPPHLLSYRVKIGRLRRLFRNVYSTGTSPAQFEREMAAVLACGGEAVLSHGSAAGMWNLVTGAAGAPIHVTVVRGDRSPGAGVRVHRMRDLHADEITRLYAIPVTTVARTILDLAATTDPPELERILAGAFRDRVATRDQLDQLVQRNPKRPGVGRLRRSLADGAEPQLTRSEAEKRSLTLFRKAGLAEPRSNVVLEGFEVDFLWSAQRVIAEVDGFAFHSARADFERDRVRDGILTAAGYRVVRITWRQLVREPEAVVARLAAALARQAHPGVLARDPPARPPSLPYPNGNRGSYE